MREHNPGQTSTAIHAHGHCPDLLLSLATNFDLKVYALFMEYNNVSFTAYLSAAIMAGLLAIIYGYHRCRQQNTGWLMLAAAVQTLHLALIAFSFRQSGLSDLWLLFFECLYFSTWVLAIALLLKSHARRQQLPLSMKLLFGVVWPITLGVLAANLLAADFILALSAWLPLLLAVIGLVSVEQLFRHVAINDRQIKLLCLNLAVLFLYDIYLYTHSLIFQMFDPLLWQSRAAVAIATCLFLSLGSLVLLQPRNRSAHMTLSRPIVFYTTSLVAVGLLISLLSLGGYYVRANSGNWGTVIYTLILISAVLAILTVFVSRNIRGRLSVLIDKHLFHHKYDYRLEWLRLINYLAQPAESREANQRAFYAIASVTKASGGAIWIHQQGFYEPVYQYRIPDFVSFPHEPDDSPFCRALRDSEWVFFPDSGNNEALSQNNELLPAWTRNIPDLWLLFPLIVAEELVGFMALTKPPTGDATLTWEDLDLLKTMGRQLASYLKRHKQAEQLAEGRQFDTYNKLVAFIIHDLNNLIAQQALVVRNAERHKSNPAFIEDAIQTISNSVDRMNHLLKKLRRDESDMVQRLYITDVVQQALADCERKTPRITADLATCNHTINADQVRLVMTITHFIRNAQEATPEDGSVHVTLRCHDNQATIVIEDTGSGMDWDFIHNRLFKPFETTKSGKGMGIGVYLSREYISELGGTLTVDSVVGKGTSITMTLPLDKD